MSTLTNNLQTIYNTKLAIKDVIGTNSDIFSDYPDLIETAIAEGGLDWDDVATYGYIVPAGSYNIIQNGTFDISTYATTYVNVPTGSGETASPTLGKVIYLSGSTSDTTLLINPAQDSLVVETDYYFAVENLFSAGETNEDTGMPTLYNGAVQKTIQSIASGQIQYYDDTNNNWADASSWVNFECPGYQYIDDGEGNTTQDGGTYGIGYVHIRIPDQHSGGTGKHLRGRMKAQLTCSDDTTAWTDWIYFWFYDFDTSGSAA